MLELKKCTVNVIYMLTYIYVDSTLIWKRTYFFGESDFPFIADVTPLVTERMGVTGENTCECQHAYPQSVELIKYHN